MSLYDDIQAAIALLEEAMNRETLENGYATAVGDLLSSALVDARHAKMQASWRINLKEAQTSGSE